MTNDPKKLVAIGFEETSLKIPIANILPLRIVSNRVKKSVKYVQIKASIKEVGIIESPVVARRKNDKDNFTLLDGHLKIEVMRELGAKEMVCLISTEDEAYTYNSQINRLATIQEHRMILNVIRKGVSEEKLARALNVNISSIRTKRNLLIGICPEVAEMLKDRRVPIGVFRQLRLLKSVRQIEATELMIAMNKFSIGYAESIVAATPPQQLQNSKPKKVGISDENLTIMQRESENLDKEMRAVEQSYGNDHLDLTMTIGYIRRLLENARIVGHLAKSHPEILAQFQESVATEV